MLDSQNKHNNLPPGGKDPNAIVENAAGPPTISLPKGGGAIRGMGEKFAANPVTGTGTLSVPVFTSPGRSGFGPQLSLSYDSGAGNGPFGLGWQLSVSQITRKTDKGLPRYRDADESDVFVFSGAEDLVHVLEENGGSWTRTAVNRSRNNNTYTVQQYRPRIEGLFARIERWTNINNLGDSFWRSISKDNITTWYGTTEESRIVDPSDPARIFTWLICESYDDKGNAILYRYKPEDSVNVDSTQVNERNRTAATRSSNRYLKRISYGNRTPRQANEDLTQRSDWLFEVVFDYGEHDAEAPSPGDAGAWISRHDPFSSYRAGFEIRTYRLCRRILMFHHFPEEQGVGDDCLVRSTNLVYGNTQNSFVTAITQTGYRRQPDGSYLSKSIPPVEFEYSQALVNEEVHEVDRDGVENVPYGLDGSRYEWIDLDGEGTAGILTKQAGGWFYKRNLSPLQTAGEGEQVSFAPVELITTVPSTAATLERQQFLDLSGDGQIDLVQLDSPTPGFYERTNDQDWSTFVAFESVPNLDWDDPNLKFVDLTGDGHADILISEEDVFVWHASLAEKGFASAERVTQALAEEDGPRLVFADGTQSIYLADFSGDGLTDLVRIRNGEVCYWPNIGYGRFGARVTMDDAPWFDAPDLFDQQRIRLADIDGSGLTDIIYLGHDAVHLYFNRSGNSWSAPQTLEHYPQIDNLSAVTVTDLLGIGTACLVWSSSLPADAERPMRYVDLMGGQKPHLLVRSTNNLGSETRVHYAPSTRFYLEDKLNDRPWITRLAFPVHVVERVETYDYVSRNRFVTRYAYHHGYFDADEREFRGFGMVEQWDTEEFAALSSNPLPASNVDQSSHVPPVLTRTWFHTGIFVNCAHVSNFFAGLIDSNDRGEYYREPGLTDEQAKALLLDDTVLAPGWTVDEEREACRALKGSMLRQEVYALDGSPNEPHPYTVAEQNFTVHRLQPKADNRHAVFVTHAREVINYHYERNPNDPRTSHALTLEVDQFGNVLKSVTIGYGRRQADPTLSATDAAKQTTSLITYTEYRFTNAIDAGDDYHTPLPSESSTFELTGYLPPAANGRFQIADFVVFAPTGASHLFDSEINFEDQPTAGRQRRLIDRHRTYYRSNDLSTRLALGQIESLALPFESYKLAFSPGLLTNIYRRVRGNQIENLLPNTTTVLGGNGSHGGGYVDLDTDGHWWVPSGRMFYGAGGNPPGPLPVPAQELAEAQQHFFLPRVFTNPFGNNIVVDYQYDLLLVRSRDALGNTVDSVNDYRVLQPRLVTDPNGNRSEVSFDVLGLLAGTALMGKVTENLGDSLTGFAADLSSTQIENFFAAGDPHVPALALLGNATSRVVYDLERFRTTRLAHPDDPAQWLPVYAATLVRETHAVDQPPPHGLRIQITFSYSDGFGREIQKKMQAEPGPLIEGGPIVSPRWVATGWSIFNNKGNPVRQYEPFFSQLHAFEFGVEAGVSHVFLYDPLDRRVVTINPNHTYEKALFDPWHQTTWDINDTVLLDPRTDADVSGFTASYFAGLNSPVPWQTWHAQRENGALGAQEQEAADKTALHAATPTVVYFDTLGRIFLTVLDNGPDSNLDPQKYRTRVTLSFAGQQREIFDAKDRMIVRSDYDLSGNRIHQVSMEAGERWMLVDVAGNLIRTWDSRDHEFRSEYDELRRPVRQWVRPTGPNSNLQAEVLFETTEYGEGQQNAAALNLRTRIFRRRDTAGIVTNVSANPATGQLEAFDFKGNALHETRQFTQNYSSIIDWSVAPAMEATVYVTSTRYDALNRPIAITTPDGSITRYSYNEANLLQQVQVDLPALQQPGPPVTTPFVTDIDYDAAGHRTSITYGNGAETRYQYDPETFRLVHLYTRRGAAFTEDCGSPPAPLFSAPSQPPAAVPCGLQNLHYTYDAVGNITHLRDDAQQTIYFRNHRIEPHYDYSYDAIYRLTTATGREHLGQNAAGAPLPPSAPTHSATRLLTSVSANDGNAMGSYRELYSYDEVGNIVEVIHRGADPQNPGWTRSYRYLEESLLEPGRQNNRLTATLVGTTTETYSTNGNGYDPHGNMLRMPHLQIMQWNFKDQLLMTQRQAVNANDEDGLLRHGERTFYVYDALGQRVRKLTELASGQLKDERIYLGDFEVYRRHGVNAVVRQTLHVTDDKQRIALVETRVNGNEPNVPQRLIRYQFANHLGSSTLELDHLAQIISYEEYYPYGSASYRAVRSQTETPKRYCYISLERDEETALYYAEARYYVSWLGRWISADPIGLRGGVNLYAYADGDPVTLKDDSGAAPEPGAAIAEKAGTDALKKKYAKAGQVVDVTPANKNLNANGLDTHLVVGKGKAAQNLIADTKFAGPTKEGGFESEIYSGKKKAGQVSSFENAAKNDYGQLVRNIRRARASGDLDPATAFFAIENAKTGHVVHDLVAAGRNTGFTPAIVQRYQASITPTDVFPESAAHRQSLELKEVLTPTKAKTASPNAVFRQFKKTINPPKLNAPKVKAGIITVVVGAVLLSDSLAIAETLDQPKGQVYVDFASSSISGLAPTPENIADTLFVIPLTIEYLDQRRKLLESVDPRWIESREISADTARLINLYSSTGETDPAAVPNLVHYDEGMVVTAPKFKQYRYK